MHLAGVAEFFFEGGRGGGLQKFAEAGAGVGESPGRNLDVEAVERGGDKVRVFSVGHGF